ncbi:Cof-type HAD-IIB family hydrolase [Floccifex sp.]|uniref:Cof-type HAD-IIB family hydrolase n=1 Tax=Floccifex sp. TaxID=2815810 RepID=UPI002A749ADD|nr:Cof-type HAD-IIB family hydrolase [Floccifex sp.]MDD7280753.1 Cof-type HAD-IIB family hydrolase [Erysipelotrichaceae bacterium]MDY2957614.1 Cof-type HAD-IIB family hydrolase [Floccifex sp.]
MSKVDAIFIDLDGTLLNSEKIVSIKNKQTLVQCLNKGIDIYLVSGRPIFFVDAIADSIDYRCHRIAFNGAVSKIGNDIYAHSVEKDNLKILWDAIQKYSINKYYFKGINSIYCSDDDSRFMYSELEEIGKIKVYKTIHSFESISDDIYKVLLIDEDDKKLEKIIHACQNHLSITSSHIHSLDIMKNNINKGDIVKKICDEKQYKQTMAFGDDINDISLLNVVSLGFAMKNAVKCLQDKAKYITEYTNEEDGVAREIYKILR